MHGTRLLSPGRPVKAAPAGRRRLRRAGLAGLVLIAGLVRPPAAFAQSGPGGAPPAAPSAPPAATAAASDAQTTLAACRVLPRGPEHRCTLVVEASFLPAWRKETAADGSTRRVSTDGVALLQVPSNEVALVLVDTWDNVDPPEGKAPPPHYQRIAAILESARRHGLTVIHAPNHPVVERYEQFEQLGREIACFVRGCGGRRPYYQWPGKNSLYDAAQKTRARFRGTAFSAAEWETIRAEARAAIPQSRCSGHPGALPPPGKKSAAPVRPGTMDISRLFRPLENEYVLASHDELRYVLFKHGIRMVIYVGGSTNECIMQRATGINSLAGIDGQRSPFTLVLVEDATSSMPTSRFDPEAMNAAMADYLKLKLAFVTTSSGLHFVDGPVKARPGTEPK